MVQARVGNHRFLPKDESNRISASGKGLTPDDARLSALGEAVERYSSLFYWPQELYYCRRSELEGRSLDPRDLVLYRPDQYANVRYAPYSEDTVLGWIPGASVKSGESVHLPAVATLMSYSAAPDELLLGVTSNGVATAGSLADAIRAATLEVIERDAFILGWVHRWILGRWDLTSHPDPEIRDLVEIYRRRGIRLHAFQLPTELGVAAFLAFGISDDPEDLPVAVAGLGADTNLARAAAKAVIEVGQIRPALRRKLRKAEHLAHMAELAADPTRVRELEDHDLLYAHPSALPKLSFLLEHPIDRRDWLANEAPPATLEWLCDHLESHGHELLYCNLTPPDMARLGLYTARAILPKFQPIDFGYHELRLGGERLHRLPVQLKFREHEPLPAELNPDPHPIA